MRLKKLVQERYRIALVLPSIVVFGETVRSYKVMLCSCLFLRRRGSGANRYLAIYLSRVSIHNRTTKPLRYTQSQFRLTNSRWPYYDQQCAHS